MQMGYASPQRSIPHHRRGIRGVTPVVDGVPRFAVGRRRGEDYWSTLRTGVRLTAVTYQRADLGSMYLPVGNMLQIDRVISVDERRIVCEMDVHPSHWVFPLHFPGDPIYPGCLQIEAAGQVVAIWAWHNGVRGSPRLAKASAEFELPIRPQPEPVVFTGTIRLRRHQTCIG